METCRHGNEIAYADECDLCVKERPPHVNP